MTSPTERRLLLQAGLLFAAGLHVRPSQACEYQASTLRVTHPWTRATPADAPHAVLCFRIDEVTADDRLVGAETPVAQRVELAGPGLGPALQLLIGAGREIHMAEAGIHLRLLGLQHALETGRSYPLRLNFERGGPVLATLNVDYARFF